MGELRKRMNVRENVVRFGRYGMDVLVEGDSSLARMCYYRE